MTDRERVVFLVDDDSAVSDSLSLLLEAAGYPVEAFVSAEAFLAGYRPNAPGCAIIDLRMPGMGGLELQEELNRRQWPLSTIFLTGYGDVPSTVKALKAGAADFLTKPVGGADLLASIAAAMMLAAYSDAT